MVTVKTT